MEYISVEPKFDSPLESRHQDPISSNPISSSPIAPPPGAHAGPLPQQAVQGITQEAHQNQHSQTNEGDEFHFTSRRSTAMIRWTHRTVGGIEVKHRETVDVCFWSKTFHSFMRKFEMFEGLAAIWVATTCHASILLRVFMAEVSAKMLRLVTIISISTSFRSINMLNS